MTPCIAKAPPAWPRWNRPCAPHERRNGDPGRRSRRTPRRPRIPNGNTWSACNGARSLFAPATFIRRISHNGFPSAFNPAEDHSLHAAGRHLYDRLRTVNPSPFAGFFVTDNLALVSSSPERLVRVAGDRVHTRPIAGTRPRGRTAVEDHALMDNLRLDEKERAEHVMLVDLARNDLGRACAYGSVRVEEFMAIEQYSHVAHLVSEVGGTLSPASTTLALMRAVFPGGTVTGAPKIRCMEIIEELEPVRRGPYTGSMGYVSWTGDLDFNILIRTMVLTRQRASFHVGAGIVADSNPHREYRETLYKAQALFDALH